MFHAKLETSNWFLSRSSLLAKDNGSRKVGCTYLPSGPWFLLLGHSHGSPDITWRGNFPANCERFSWKSKPRFTNICAPRGRPLHYGKLEFELAPGQLLCHLPEELSTGIEYMERLKKKKGDNAIRKGTKILSFVVSFFNSINVSVRIILSLKRRRFVALRESIFNLNGDNMDYIRLS